jgi:hypothetical protein
LKTSWLIGVLALFIVMSLISGILELQYLSGTADQEGIFERLFAPPVVTSGNVIGIVWSGITTTWDSLTAFWDLLWFNYTFFTGAYGIVRWIVFFPISIALILTLSLAAIRGVGSE